MSNRAIFLVDAIWEEKNSYSNLVEYSRQIVVCLEYSEHLYDWPDLRELAIKHLKLKMPEALNIRFKRIEYLYLDLYIKIE